MSNREDYKTSRRNGRTIALALSAVVVILAAVGVAYSTGQWGHDAMHVGNDGAGLHIPPPAAGARQPAATNVATP